MNEQFDDYNNFELFLRYIDPPPSVDEAKIIFPIYLFYLKTELVIFLMTE
jgi:hypothetical protein